MVELQGIHVAVVPITPKGGNDVTTKFEELPMSKSQNCYKIAPKDRHKQVSQFVRVKEDAQFGVKIKASDVDKWLMTNDRANAVLIEVTIDGGSLVQKELVMKKDVKSKITTINRFVHGEGKGVQIARAHFEQRNDRSLDVRFWDEPSKREGEIVVKLTQGQSRPRRAIVRPEMNEMIELKGGVCKKATDGLMVAGITLFAAPELGWGKTKVVSKMLNFAFTKRFGADDLKFTFAYRVSDVLVQDEHGAWLSRRVATPYSYMPQSPAFIRPQIRHPLRSHQAEQPVTPEATPSPDTRVASQNHQALSANELQESIHASRGADLLSAEDLAAVKRRWAREHDDEEMSVADFKRQKLERTASSPVSYEITTNGQIDLTNIEVRARTADTNRVKEDSVPINLPMRPSPRPHESLQPQQPFLPQRQNPPNVDIELMDDAEIELEYCRNRDKLFRLEMQRRKAQANTAPA